MTASETTPGTNGASNRAIAESVERGYVFKAHVIGRDITTTPASKTDDGEDALNARIFGEGNVLHPPYDPAVLLRIWENSGSLGPNVDSYVTNIDGLGHRLEAVVDLASEEAFETVRELMWIERLRRAEQEALIAQTDADPDTQPADIDAASMFPSDDEVEARIETLRAQARIERVRLKSFFDYANPDGSFTTLRRQTRQHLEITGNAYWEVLRNRAGEIARFVLVPPQHVRCTALDGEATTVRERVPLGLGWEVVTQRRFFRRYVQRMSRTAVWFKQFGDPRVIGQATGKVYSDRADFEMNKDEGDVVATEMIHFRIPRPGEAYGQPRWVGNLLAVLGSRAADEVNFTYFDNKAVPPLALLVSGGKLNDSTVQRIETYIRDEIRGRQNFHKVLVIEATGTPQMSGEVPVPKITFQPLVAAQQSDAQFQKYDERNIDKVGSSFRLPRLLRGDVRDFNRATADASLRFADEQVFQPERNEFDDWINRVLLPRINARLWAFRSQGPRTRDPETIAGIVKDSLDVMIPNEARTILADALGRDLPKLSDGWARQPLKLTLAGFATPEQEDAIEDAVDGFTTAAADAAADDADDDDALRLLTTEARALAARARAVDGLHDAADSSYAAAQRAEAASGSDGADSGA